ncbi:hypothetical protein C8Q75DRAFT_264148 [Abortiporus biennis]|nr:hypothetical protein C8Q75DRAFT_264148 [Abortiporus biennis]
MSIDEISTSSLARAHMGIESFPQELLDHIIDFLHDDKKALCTCSLICRSFLQTARYHLWRSLHITTRTEPSDKTTFRQFLDHLQSSPSTFCENIQFLTLDGNNDIHTASNWAVYARTVHLDFLFELLNQLPSLRELKLLHVSIKGRYSRLRKQRRRHDAISASKHASSSALHTLTLSYATLVYPESSPHTILHFLSAFPNLRNLICHSISSHTCQGRLRCSHPLRLPTITSLEMTSDGALQCQSLLTANQISARPLFDLRYLRVDCSDSHDVLALQSLIDSTRGPNALEEAHIGLFRASFVHGECITFNLFTFPS